MPSKFTWSADSGYILQYWYVFQQMYFLYKNHLDLLNSQFFGTFCFVTLFRQNEPKSAKQGRKSRRGRSGVKLQNHVRNVCVSYPIWAWWLENNVVVVSSPLVEVKSLHPFVRGSATLCSVQLHPIFWSLVRICLSSSLSTPIDGFT